MAHILQEPLSNTNVLKDACFHCKKQGHWVRDCPERVRPGDSCNPPPSASTAADPTEYPAHYCECGRGICQVSVSTKKYPGRKFYHCSCKGPLKCDYFNWCDQLSENELRSTPPETLFPICGCGAGVCTKLTDPSGCVKFICPIKKGQGACGFIHWPDMQVRNGQVDQSSTSVCLEDQSSILISPEDQSRILISTTDKSSTLISPDDHRARNNDCEHPLDEIPVQLEQIESNSTFTGSSPNCNDPVQNAFENGFVSELNGESSVENVQASNEFQLVEFSRQIVSPTDPLSAGVAEAPFVGLEDHPITELVKKSKLNPCSKPSQSLHGLGNIMAGTVSQAFDNLGAQVRDSLVTLLESMNPHDHEKMVDEATITFTALQCLQVDCKIFCERVKGYIEQAKRLAEVEEVIGSDASSEELINRYYSEKSRFEEISHAHSEAMRALAASSSHMQSVRREASCLKDLLLEAELELASCEAETVDIQARLLQISEKMFESKKSLESASREAAEALKHSEQQEIELSAAKAAFEKARAQLRR
ncbi:hypothetical protein Nepgr_008736 [Nepenthes gracilis]|uniref:CCHC-type domain-containing protein n=1 Tax=Nepenthes gracilis TaxID=150966 RepID=A0AAD3S9K2_NEPGR|nr:hypothetical protein Nepgr_008736 [Nepenthes gracilis]